MVDLPTLTPVTSEADKVDDRMLPKCRSRTFNFVREVFQANWPSPCCSMPIVKCSMDVRTWTITHQQRLSPF